MPTNDAEPQQLEVERLRGELVRVRRDLGIEAARLESRASQLENRIQDLTRRSEKTYDAVAQPDGKITTIDASGVWIDIGTQHGLRNGTSFQVYDEPGGRTRLKALLTVDEVEAARARCVSRPHETVDPASGEKVTLPLADAPLVEGDLVRNPFFERGEVRSFVLLGTQVRGTTTVGELVQRLAASGSRVSDAVDVDTDFVVLLPDGELVAPEQVERARLFGVVFMTEAELLHHLGLGPPQER